MRLATFNLMHGRSLADGLVDVDRVGAAVGGRGRRAELIPMVPVWVRQASAIHRSAALEPVNVTLLMPGFFTRYAPISQSPGTMLTTPGGRSAAVTVSANAYASRTASGDGGSPPHAWGAPRHHRVPER